MLNQTAIEQAQAAIGEPVPTVCLTCHTNALLKCETPILPPDYLWSDCELHRDPQNKGRVYGEALC